MTTDDRHRRGRAGARMSFRRRLPTLVLIALAAATVGAMLAALR